MLSDRDEFGASIDNSKEKLIDDDGMTKNNAAADAEDEEESGEALSCRPCEIFSDRLDIVRT